MQIILYILVLFGVLFWIQQIINVVSMKDEEFEGRNDKLIFFLIVFFGAIPGAIGFWIWKLSRSWSPSDVSFSWSRSSSGLSQEEEQAMARMTQEVLEEKRRKDEEQAKENGKGEKQDR